MWERHRHETASDETCGLSRGRIDGVEAVQSHEDAIFTTTSSSSSFLTLSQYLAHDNLGIHEEPLDLRRPTASRNCVDSRVVMTTALTPSSQSSS